MFSPAMPPLFLGISAQALCEYWLSIEQPRTSAPRFWNSDRLSEYALISVGQTKVKSRG